MNELFKKAINAGVFFPKYAPNVNNYRHKIRGKNGRGNDLEFTDADKREIKKGLRQLFKDLLK